MFCILSDIGIWHFQGKINSGSLKGLETVDIYRGGLEYVLYTQTPSLEIASHFPPPGGGEQTSDDNLMKSR